MSRTLSDTSCPTDSDFWGSIWDHISNLLTQVSYQDDPKYYIILYYFEIISQDFEARFHSRAVLCKNEEGGANALAAATRPWADFWFFVCRCVSKNDRTSHISVAPGEVLEICQEAAEKHIFKSFLGRFFFAPAFPPHSFQESMFISVLCYFKVTSPSRVINWLLD